MEEQKKKELRSRQAHQAEAGAFAEQGVAGVQAEERQLEKTKKDTAQWRTKEVQNKEEIVADKKKRADTAKAIEERKEKERVYTEKQHKFFESFRAAASKKAHEERENYEHGQDLKSELLRAESAAHQEKMRADSDELALKNDIEREGLRLRDQVSREFRELDAKLFREETVKKTPTATIEKKRAELRTEEQRRQQEVHQLTMKKKTDAEARTRKRKAEIDRAFEEKKAAIRREQEKLK
jgi:hypothetical protein